MKTYTEKEKQKVLEAAGSFRKAQIWCVYEHWCCQYHLSDRLDILLNKFTDDIQTGNITRELASEYTMETFKKQRRAYFSLLEIIIGKQFVKDLLQTFFKSYAYKDSDPSIRYYPMQFLDKKFSWKNGDKEQFLVYHMKEIELISYIVDDNGEYLTWNDDKLEGLPEGE